MATLTIKGIPRDIYERLKRRAKANRRSLNQEAITVIEQALEAPPIDVDSTIARARKIRELTAHYEIKEEEIQRWKREGRK